MWVYSLFPSLFGLQIVPVALWPRPSLDCDIVVVMMVTALQGFPTRRTK